MSQPYTVKNGNEALTSHSGLALIGALLNQRTHLKARLNTVTLSGCVSPKITHADMVFSMLGLICLAKPDYDVIEPFRADDFFKNSLSLDACPSSSALRQRLDLANGDFNAIIKEESARDITPILTANGPRVPLDIDVSPFDNSKTHKEGVSRTYKGHDGFAPNFAYLGQEGYLVNVELCAGKQHCQSGTPAFLREALTYCKQITSQPLLARLDSGNDSVDNLKIFIEKKVDFIIKRNIRRESPEAWLELAQATGQAQTPRPGKTVYRGSVYRQLPEIEQPVRIVFDITERTIDKHGQILLVPDIEIDTYWVSLPDAEPEVIELYHDHGTAEQYHSELKSDLDLERFPSQYFETNRLILVRDVRL